MKTAAWRAIIFDFDGVVVESGEIKTQAFANLYQEYGEEVMVEVAKYHVLNGGMSRYQKFRYFQETLLEKPPLTAEEERQLDQRFSELVVEAVIASAPVPGAAELIQREAGRIPLFVASGTPETELNTIVVRRGLGSYFTAVRGSPTPKQKLIADILTTHRLLPERVLMIGDALIDYQSAMVNNVAFIGRVRPGDQNPFPAHVDVLPDLSPLLL
ncbi:MAG: haloacid dehalogenase [Nitrosomonadales bacterium SCN 54-20]|jgi:phosphoglycolate phosphatase-like HAD superfamily hydrolase|uniref:phosphoglycolate phosphatase n=1 Tax=Nitrosospira multiformis TaxID=1231 RepID=A0A1I0AHJ9_9PROT|nr:HAD family hydrolase [Nitrosospira multiformis]MCC2680519.1 Haloacid dehalogenase-like hydrolase [Nitrosospira multiformis]ODT84425.1 MAG: haloacid dehalogenase [Nitrosomonadales bacterium SCN 54-20]SES93653.1 Phosphoglycolate phosphatase, HAD superfamily [Nitrosospira multiformis]